MNRKQTMNYANKFKKAAPLLLLPIMGSALAAEVSVPLNFTTLPVIEIEERQALAFGDVLSLTQSHTCTMDAKTGTIALTPALEGADLTNATIYPTVAPAIQSGNLSGNCSGDDGNVGIYEITSFANANITVSVTNGTSGGLISFTPVGYVTNLIEGTGGKATREELKVGTDALVNASEALSAFAAAGTNRAIIGGTITNQNTLTAGDQYTADFNLNVVYQ